MINVSNLICIIIYFKNNLSANNHNTILLLRNDHMLFSYFDFYIYMYIYIIYMPKYQF